MVLTRHAPAQFTVVHHMRRARRPFGGVRFPPLESDAPTAASMRLAPRNAILVVYDMHDDAVARAQDGCAACIEAVVVAVPVVVVVDVVVGAVVGAGVDIVLGR